MADIKISELTAVSTLNNGDLVEVSQVNELAPSGYTSLKATMTDLGKKVNTDIEYTTDLADFTDKTTLGAIKETAKGKNIADEYDNTQNYDKGDVVIYKNTLYICTTNNTTGTWDATKWTAATVQSLIGSLSTLTTTEKSSIVGAVNEVNGKKITAQAIVSDTALTTTATDYNTVSSRKFSDYDLIVFKLGNSLTDTRRTVVLPSSIWSSGWTINEGVLHGSTASTPSSYQYSSFSISYKSDTSITASVSGSGTIAHLAIYGLKLST